MGQRASFVFQNAGSNGFKAVDLQGDIRRTSVLARLVPPE